MKLSSFRKLIKSGVALLCAFVLMFGLAAYSAGGSVYATSQSALEKKLKENKAKQDEINSALSELKKDITKEKEYQKQIDLQIEATEEYIRSLSDLIDEYDNQISNLDNVIAGREEEIVEINALIESQEEEIQEGVNAYTKQLRAMYIFGNNSVASVIMGASDFFDMLMKMELVKRVAEKNNNAINSLLNTKSNYETNKDILEEKISVLERDKEAVLNKMEEVKALRLDFNSQLDDLQALYAESEAEEKKLKKQRDAYEANKDDLEKEAKKMEDEIQRIIREAERRAYMGDLPEGTFLWPVPGFYAITSGYGSRWGTTHRGIDISGSGIRGASITAANSGVVIAVYNGCTHDFGKSKSCGCGGGFGNYCMIDHGGGYVTLYGHATKITVSEGQHVTTGQKIGIVGTTGYSTGNHLHFEVRVNGERRDPEKFNLIKK